MTEAETSELWQHYSQKYLDRYGERPTMRISDRDSLILAILDLENPDDYDDTYDDTSFD